MAIDNPFNFSNRVVLVTGAGTGIGLGIARRFAEAGASVALHYRANRAAVDEAIQAVESQGGRASAFQADLSQPDQAQTLIEQVSKKFGRLDILINNAGLYPSTPLLELPLAEWDQVLDINLRAVFLCTQAAARVMIAQGQGGAIVNIASIEANFPALGHSHYASAKAAVVMFTRNSALELAAHAIRVNTVSPGLIWREGLEADWPEGVASWKENAPLKRLGAPQDVADACLFLASANASWITGANLDVDGGVSTRPAF